MNPELNCIFSRRSIRKYLDKAVPGEMLDDLLQTAMAAPSAVAKDPWHFICAVLLLAGRQKSRKPVLVIEMNGYILRNGNSGSILTLDCHWKPERNQREAMIKDVTRHLHFHRQC